MILEDILKGLTAPIADYMKSREERKAKEKEIAATLHIKKMEQLGKAADYEQAWNMAQINNSGWKDDGWTIIFMIPFVGVFIPPLVPYILGGFSVLEKMPSWYKGFVGVSVSASFGLQAANKMWKWYQSP